MASLHKDPRNRSPYFYAAFYGADNQRCFRSTKTTDRKEAQRIASEWEDAAALGRARTLTTSQVRKVFNDILSKAGDETLDNFTTRTWFDEWIAGKRASRGGRTGERYEKPLNDFLAHLGSRANLPLRAATSRDVRLFRDSEQKTGKSPVTVNLAHKILTGVFAAARRQGFIPSNPAEAVDYLPTHESKAEKGTFEAREVEAVLKATTSEDWRGVILLGYLAGMRLGDALRLQWGNVDLVNGVITFTPSKTARLGKSLTVPIHPDLEAFLLSHPAGKRESAPLFPSLANRAIGGKSGASMAFKRIMENAKVAAGIAREGQGKQGRDVSKRSFHSLRHSHISALSNAGVAVEVRQKMVGHSDQSTNLGYTHPEFASLKAAMDKLPRINTGAKK